MRLLSLVVILALFVISACSPVVENDGLIGEPVNGICGDGVCQANEEEFGSCKADCGGVAGVTKAQCYGAGGKWNECGSACAGLDTDMCIEVCSEQCECDNNQYFCPEKFTCRLSGKAPKMMGVCVK